MTNEAVLDNAFFVADYRRVSEMADGTQVLRIESDGAWQKQLFERIGFGGNASKKHCWVAISLLTDQAASEFFQRINTGSSNGRTPDFESGNLGSSPSPVTKGEHGDYARKLYRQNFFKHPDVWQACGSDDKFLAWIRLQPSCIDDDDFNIQSCHVRRVKNGAGTAIKPDYSAVPMTGAQHDIQTRLGEACCLNTFQLKSRTCWTVEEAKDWFDERRWYYLEEWCKYVIKEKTGYAGKSLADIPPEVFTKWAEANNLTKYLPAE